MSVVPWNWLLYIILDKQNNYHCRQCKCPSETTEHVSTSFQTPLYHVKWKDPCISQNSHTRCGMLVSSTTYNRCLPLPALCLTSLQERQLSSFLQSWEGKANQSTIVGTPQEFVHPLSHLQVKNIRQDKKLTLLHWTEVLQLRPWGLFTQEVTIFKSFQNLHGIHILLN